MTINKIPWWGKIAAKVILSRVPFGYRFWKALRLFQHGAMERPAYAYEIFMRHFKRFGRPEFVGLELGPGDSLFSALIASATGSTSYYLVDMAYYAQQQPRAYLRMAQYLKEKGMKTPDLQNTSGLEEILDSCGATYKTAGLESLREIPTNSVDFIWSQAVLEHVKRADFSGLMKELRRIIRQDGLCSHRIDLRDHLGGGINHLRFSEKIWESDFISCSGFYTNRMPYSEMLSCFKTAGFGVEIVSLDRRDALPISKKKLDQKFRNLTEEELCVQGFDVLLRPA
ncbi:MAG: methyltransferase domain-containing protein [Elusimicrobia bacterium]|nr:methyltransferase domain-containing protein [Elusimicrobiota bacterium]